MSGYLQRLAQGASRPSANVRPVLDPLFSGLKPREGAAPFPVEENVTEIADPSPLSRAAPGNPAEFSERVDPAGRRAAPRLLPDAGPKGDSRGYPAGEAGRSRGRSQPGEAPSAARRDPVQAQAVSPHFLVASPQTGEALGLRSAGDSDAGLEAPRGDTRGAPEGGLRPGLPAGPLVPLIRGQSSASPAIRGNPAAQRPRRDSGAEPREPDEINIHIGRIEVTAVQPQSSGAAAPRTRRSGTSLDEYLRQRDRKSP
jgi:hypothetical protein